MGQVPQNVNTLHLLVPSETHSPEAQAYGQPAIKTRVVTWSALEKYLVFSGKKMRPRAV